MWSAKVTSITPNETIGMMAISVLIENKDDQGAILDSIPEIWNFEIGDIPSAEVLAARLRSAAQRKADIKAQRDLILNLVNNPVSIPDTPPLFPEDMKTVSKTDQAIMSLKAQAKPMAVDFIKANAACSLDDVFNFFNGTSSDLAHLSQVLCSIYREGAFNKGLIPEDTWEALRDWIVATPVETLMAI